MEYGYLYTRNITHWLSYYKKYIYIYVYLGYYIDMENIKEASIQDI